MNEVVIVSTAPSIYRPMLENAEAVVTMCVGGGQGAAALLEMA